MIRAEEHKIHLEGNCGVEEAETLAALLEEDGPWEVDLSGCGHLHGALVQAMLIFRPRLRGLPEDVFMKGQLYPALAFALEDR